MRVKIMRKLKKKISILICALVITIFLGSCSNDSSTTLITSLTKDNLSYYIYEDNNEYYACLYEYSGNAESLIIPDTVEYDSKDIEITTINQTTFSGNKTIEKITLGSNISSVAERTFMGLSNLKTVVLNDKLEYLDMYLFSRSGIEEITINENVKTISSAAFLRSNITNIVLLSTNVSISSEAFLHCDKLTNVYFKGSADEFENLNISNGNDDFMNATRSYYSETQPTESGNYWHYVNNTVTLW